MNVFEAVKQNVTTRQAAELYGITVSRNGMAVCPFHNDKNPSMKLDRRFHCFGCQADGDAVDFVSRLFQLPSKEAAMKLADDLGIAYDNRQKPTVKPHIREPTPEQKYRQEEMHCYSSSLPTPSSIRTATVAFPVTTKPGQRPFPCRRTAALRATVLIWLWMRSILV